MDRFAVGTAFRALAIMVRGAGAICVITSLASAALPVRGLAQEGAVVQGTVRNAVTAAPVENATVRVVGTYRARTTGADGRYRFTLAKGSIELRVTAIGFAAESRTVPLAPGGVVAADFSLRPAAVSLDEVVTTGTRTTERTRTQSPVPVDVVTARALENTGAVETWQQLQHLVPSVNVPHIPLGDNHMRPVTLRGLDPNHTLVLVNGKRWHPAAALLAGPSVPDRSFTDIGAIPPAAIERIEVLRDGASAEYGSDAIAGVVNIVLKSGDAHELRATAGEVRSAEGGRDFRDGRTLDATAALGVTSHRGGYVTASAQVLERSGTNRAYPDRRPQYFTGDPRNDSPAQVTSHFGDGTLHDASVLVNAATPLARDVELYAVVAAARRDGVTPDAFFRRPLDPRTVLAIHPNGFLPAVESRIGDVSTLAGIRGSSRRWRWDLSSVWGGNGVDYSVRNSNNASLGAVSPTDFSAGRVSAQQWTTNADVSREVRVRFVPLTISGGAEYRVETFRIAAGDSDSWRDGRASIAAGPLAGQPAAAGAQGMTGFRPLDEVAPRRASSAAYVEIESRLVPRFLLQTAGRVEHYSDFGSTANGKISARVDLVRGLALRGSASTGFRAPALTQEYLSRTSTIARISGGVTTFLLLRTFPVNTPEAQLLGATPLRPESSVNRSAGAVLELPWLGLVTADFYRIDLRDRIGTTGATTDTTIIRLFQENGFRGIGGGGFFTNAWDTRTTGVDLTAARTLLVGRDGALQLVGGYNRTRTRITRVAALPGAPASVASELVSRTGRGVIEDGQPGQTIVATLDYTVKRLGVTIDGQRAGPTAQLDAVNPAGDQIVPARWITNARLAYQLLPRVQLAVSALNLFDVYPVEWFDFKQGLNARGFSMQGIFRYPGALSPFGMNGRTLYLQLAYR